MSNSVLGIDIGGTNTEFGLVSNLGDILYSGSVKTRLFDSPEALAEAIYDDLQSNASHIDIAGIGIGAPNGNFHTGNIEFAPNLVWKGSVPLASIFTSQFGVPVRVTNDANAAAMGEHLFGSVRGLKDFLVVTLGTGVGSGFMVNGEILYGHSGMAGELGHVTIEPNGRACPCGRIGCLERYTSSIGFKITTSELLLSSPTPSVLRDVPDAERSAVSIDRAARAGDELALAAFELTAEYLARGLATAVAITSPEAIILCGGLARAGKLLLDPTEKHLNQQLLPIFQNTVKLIPSSLSAGNIAVLGAAALGWEHR